MEAIKLTIGTLTWVSLCLTLQWQPEGLWFPTMYPGTTHQHHSQSQLQETVHRNQIYSPEPSLGTSPGTQLGHRSKGENGKESQILLKDGCVPGSLHTSSYVISNQFWEGEITASSYTSRKGSLREAGLVTLSLCINK